MSASCALRRSSPCRRCASISYSVLWARRARVAEVMAHVCRTADGGGVITYDVVCVASRWLRGKNAGATEVVADGVPENRRPVVCINAIEGVVARHISGDYATSTTEYAGV